MLADGFERSTIRKTGIVAMVLLILGLGSCADRYTKFGAAEGEWESDSSQCKRGASRDFYQRCLELRGWRKQ